MRQSDYQTQLLNTLRHYTPKALTTLAGAQAALPDKATSINIIVHPGQEETGNFSVLIHLSGPDLYVLNKAIKDHRILFDTQWISNDHGELSLYHFDPFDLPFALNDTIVETAILWMKDMWDAFDNDMSLPVQIFGDGWGSDKPTPLQQKISR